MEETEYNEIKSKITNATGKPVCIQALWDGDTSGWFLILSVVLKKSGIFRKKYEEMYLTTIRQGGDLRICNGEVPPWPEAVIGQEIGKRLSKEFHTAFFFPSSSEPDDDCPNWLNREKGINCVNCKKLIIPSWSQHRRKDMCYNCELRAEKIN
jgi:hypothetical protein